MKNAIAASVLICLLAMGCTQAPPAGSSVSDVANPTPTVIPTGTPRPLLACPGENGTITRCGCVIGQPGSYSLQHDLTALREETCVTFTAGSSGSVLDCAGHSMTGAKRKDEASGVLVANASNITVLDCAVSTFKHGIFLSNSSGSVVEGSNMADNMYGLHLNASTGSIITGNIAVSPGCESSMAVVVNASSGNTFTDNIICGGDVNILCDSAQEDGSGNTCGLNGAGDCGLSCAVECVLSGTLGIGGGTGEE